MTADPVKLRMVIALGQKMREAQKKARETRVPADIETARRFGENFDFAAEEAMKP